MFNDFNELLKFIRDEHFQEFFIHPKVQALMKDKDFEKAVKEKNIFKLMAHEEFSKILKDPDLVGSLEKMRRKFKQAS